MTDNQLATVNELEYSYQPAVITADFEAMQERLDDLLEPYKGLDAEAVAQMPEADVKSCYRDLNAIRNSVEEGRKAVKREYNKPLATFEARVKELVAQIDGPRNILKEAKDLHEEQARRGRLMRLDEVYREFAPALAELVPIEKVIDPRWLNKSYGEKRAENELCDHVAGINADWRTLQDAQLHFPAETERRFFDTLNLRDALAYDREEWEKQQALDTMKAEVEDVRGYQEPEVVEPTTQMFQDGTQYRFSIEIPRQEFVTNIIEATALKNHLAQLGIKASMTKSKEAVA